MIKADLNIALKNPKEALAAIAPDFENTERFKIFASVQKNRLNIKIEASDITATRMAINSCLRIIGSIKNIEEVTN